MNEFLPWPLAFGVRTSRLYSMALLAASFETPSERTAFNSRSPRTAGPNHRHKNYFIVAIVETE
jgi:hypothetical protein